jgi:TATA-binding protein-associated factor Taf7
MDNINIDKIIKPDELDYNMILSVPEDIGIKLQKIIHGNATQEEKNSSRMEIIESLADNMENPIRKLIFKIGDTMLPMTIMDMPCIVEAKKTIDYKTFYKSSDISQMMFVHDKEHKLNAEDEIAHFNPFKNDQYFNKLAWKKDPDHPYKFKHGLSKCTRNIRAKRFKRKNKYNSEEMKEVSKKLKLIIDVRVLLI